MFQRSETGWAALFCAAASMIAAPVRADNQTADLSPIVIGGSLPFTTQILPQPAGGGPLPTLQSFAKAQFGGQWLLMSGLTGGMHSLADGFFPQEHNTNAFVIDPATRQVWSRSLVSDASAGLTQDQIDALSATNTEFTQQGTRLYIAGGFGQGTVSGEYHTYDTLTSVNVPGLMAWVKGGAGTAAANLRQISDPLFQVTGGEMLTSTSTGKTHLVFGQNYPASYEPRQTGEYTKQVRTFKIIDDAAGLSVSDVVSHAPQEDFRRRDLNVVPIIQNVNGQLVEKTQALAGVFTTSFGTWTVPVTIDADGNAIEPDPLAASTFKQGMNSYRAAHVELYSAQTNTMHSLQLGGISYQFYDPASGTIKGDLEIPYINDLTDIVTDSTGQMTQYLLPGTYPVIPAPTNGTPLLLGTETEFFLKDGIATYANGVIDLDMLSGPTVVGYLFGGIAADAPNGGHTTASSALFPVVITPVPEPGALLLTALTVFTISQRRGREPNKPGLPLQR